MVRDHIPSLCCSHIFQLTLILTNIIMLRYNVAGIFTVLHPLNWKDKFSSSLIIFDQLIKYFIIKIEAVTFQITLNIMFLGVFCVDVVPQEVLVKFELGGLNVCCLYICRIVLIYRISSLVFISSRQGSCPIT